MIDFDREFIIAESYTINLFFVRLKVSHLEHFLKSKAGRRYVLPSLSIPGTSLYRVGLYCCFKASFFLFEVNIILIGLKRGGTSFDYVSIFRCVGREAQMK